MNGIVLQTFCLFLCELLTHCDSVGEFMDADLFLDNYNNDNNPHVLNVIIEHCCEEYDYKKLAIVSVSDDDQELSFQFYRNIHEEFFIPVEVFNDINQLNLIGWQSCVILYLSNEQIGNFSKIFDNYSWIPNNIYVIHYSSNEFEILDQEQERLWSISALELWKKNYVHKFILSINGRNLFFDPFEPSENLENSKDLNTMNGTTKLLSKNCFGVLKDLGNSSQLLKRRDTFEGYEVNVALFPYVTVEKHNNDSWSGPDTDAMYEICKQMKIIPRIFEPPEQFGWYFDGKFFGTLGRLVYHHSDFAFNGFFIKYYGSRMLEFSTYLNSDRICVVVAKRPRVPEYLLIVRIFSVQSWVLIIMGNCFVALTSAGMTNLNFESQRMQKLEKSFENSPVNAKRKRKLTRVQQFIENWIFLCFYPVKIKTRILGQRLNIALGLMLGIVIGGCFTSQLASNFSRPAFLKNIETLAEFDDSGLKVLTSFPNLLDDVFADKDSSTYRNLQMKLELKNTSEIKTQVALREAGYLDRLHALKLTKHPNDQLHIVSEYPQEYPLAYPIPKGSPFLPRMNAIIGRLQNGGLYNKWFQDMTNPSKNEQSENPVVIRLPHLYIPFFILLIGLGISGGIFCCELYCSSANKTLPVQGQQNMATFRKGISPRKKERERAKKSNKGL